MTQILGIVYAFVTDGGKRQDCFEFEMSVIPPCSSVGYKHETNFQIRNNSGIRKTIA